METKLTALGEFLNLAWQQRPDQKLKPGKPPVYSTMSFVLFFVLMLLKHIHGFKPMHKWAKANYALLGWRRAPDRKTIRRRFLDLPTVLQVLMPTIARQCLALNYSLFGYAWSYADKSVFRALGGLWHKSTSFWV